MDAFHVTIVVAAAYLALGAVVGLVHPGLVRSVLADMRNAELTKGGVFWKPVMALVFFTLICMLWPVAWFKRRQSERKTTAQLERLRPFMQLHAAANKPVRYSGGDGSSFENAIVILDADMLSGVSAEYKYIAIHHPGYGLRKQSFKEREGRKFDVLELVSATGQDTIVYFDISGFHGKPPTTLSPIAQK